MESHRKFIIELEGRPVYASRSYENTRKVAWRIIKANPFREVIVHLSGIIVGI